MKKWIFPIMLSSSLLCSTSLLAQDYNNETVTPSNTATPASNETMTTTTTDGNKLKGYVYEVTPKRSDVTVEYCKAHAPDTYETNPRTVYKVIVGDNGVKAKDLGFTTKEIGGIYMHTGTAMFSGEIDGKPWQEKVWYFSQTLDKGKGMEQGVWYTKDCKGFYKFGPA